ncbi:MAG: hypothetical protein LBM28_01570 [Oscillospiraceae bacterium]|jgi:hypothetical protein|nr:hypothetical protein [Oscillospiraceae bacterium]
MSSLKNDWEKTGKELGSAFESLGKSLVRSIKSAAKKADEWANEDKTAPTSEEKSDK